DDHRQRQTDLSRPIAVLLRQLSREDRDEDDVVDAENDLEDRQCSECNPPFHAGRPAEPRRKPAAHFAFHASCVSAGSSESPAQVSGSCHMSVDRYNVTSSAGKDVLIARTASRRRSAAGACTSSSSMRPFSCLIPNASRKAAIIAR